ncbi:MAG TPA: DUF5615 family PIN-like protein [Ktedonobacterales bacterium]|nr:DUF5615 family PIN-like protein [Ktedonobacterales bacterium]
MSDHAAAGSPPRFMTDVNFNWRIIVGLRRRKPEVDVFTAQELGLREAPDPELLEYARQRGRILLTHDVNTMPQHFNDLLLRLPHGEHSPGVILIP